MRDRFAVISDIHGNLEGLQAVLSALKKENVSDIICLGDVVGYGADPEVCWKLIKQRCSICLKGNHEAILCGETDDSDCSNLGKQSAEWTRENVSDDIREELSELPWQMERFSAKFYHSTPNVEDGWPYLNRLEQIIAAFESTPSPLVFYGHTHRPRITIVNQSGAVVVDEMIQETKEFQVNLRDHRCYINPGSAGQQRDTRTDVSFSVCTIADENAKIKVYRIPYKRFRAYRKIRKTGCGKAAATYLVREKWRRDWFEFIDYRG